MFFKELCMFYTVYLSMFICCAYLFCLRQLCYNIMCCFLCQQLFSTFFDFVFALSTKALKTHQCFVDLLLPCSATLVNIHPSSTKVNIIFKNIFKKAFWPIRTISISVFVHFAHLFSISETKRAATWWQPYLFTYLLNNSIPTFTLWIVSSLPMISIISVAPAGVICFPETAVLIGQSAYPFLQPLSATYFMSIS